VRHFGGFFHQIKVRQPIGRKDSKQTVHEPKKQEVGGFFVFSGSEFRTLLKNSSSKFKNQRPIAVDVR
jgi:hypothetical protein